MGDMAPLDGRLLSKMTLRITRTKRVKRQALMEVLASPQATPKQKLDAQARLNRLKYKPRGRHVAKANSEQNTEATQPVTTGEPAHQPLSPAERIHALIETDETRLSSAQQHYLLGLQKRHESAASVETPLAAN